MWAKFFEVVFIGSGVLLLLMVLIIVFVIATAMKFERMRQVEDDGLRELFEKNRLNN
jgi:hypothetical protein